MSRFPGGYEAGMSSKYRPGIEASMNARMSAAQRFAEEIFPHIDQAERERCQTYQDIADWLNAKGIGTRRGMKWRAESVSRVMMRSPKATLSDMVEDTIYNFAGIDVRTGKKYVPKPPGTMVARFKIERRR